MNLPASPGRPFDSRHLTEREILRAQALRADLSLAETAAELNRSPKTLAVVLSRVRNGHRPIRSLWETSAEATATMIDMIEHGLTITDVAQFYGIGLNAVSARLTRAGFDAEVRAELGLGGAKAPPSRAPQ